VSDFTFATHAVKWLMQPRQIVFQERLPKRLFLGEKTPQQIQEAPNFLWGAGGKAFASHPTREVQQHSQLHDE
jgi:hypothetical protein